MFRSGCRLSFRGGGWIVGGGGRSGLGGFAFVKPLIDVTRFPRVEPAANQAGEYNKGENNLKDFAWSDNNIHHRGERRACLFKVFYRICRMRRQEFIPYQIP